MPTTKPHIDHVVITIISTLSGVDIDGNVTSLVATKEGAVLDILTFTPIRSGVLLKAGIRPSLAAFDEFIGNLPDDVAEVVYPSEADQTNRYYELEKDSYDLRILIWGRRVEMNDQSANVEIHLYGNNIAIAQVRLMDCQITSSRELEANCQKRTADVLCSVYEEFDQFLENHIRSHSELMADVDKSELSLKNGGLDFDRMSRALILKDNERAAPGMADLCKTWLQDTLQPDDAPKIISGELDHSMTWVNYVLVDRSTEAVTDPSFRLNVSSMRIAQYFWSAQEWFNHAAQDSIYSAMKDKHLARAEANLKLVRSQMQMVNIEFNEAKIHMNRRRQALVRGLLDGWGFGELTDTGQMLIELSSDQLQEITDRHNKANTAITDILLVGLSFFALLEVLFYVLEFSREIQLRPSLSLMDGAPSKILGVIASWPIDHVLIASFIVMGILFLIYVFLFLITKRFR